VFLMCTHQRSWVSSRMREKASLLDVNQEQYVKCECFSDLMSVRVEKARAKQVALCFWCSVPLRTHPATYDRRSALHASTCSCMSKDWSGCSPRTVKPWRESLRILCHAFIRKMYGLVLSTRLEHEVPYSCSCT
jgi:hypothetical protein